MDKLANKSCIPCSGDVPGLIDSAKLEFLKGLNKDWVLSDNKLRLQRRVEFDDFKEPFQLLQKIAVMAEEQWHHPVLKLSWGALEVEIWTHKINDLVESDFIFAAKVDAIIDS